MEHIKQVLNNFPKNIQTPKIFEEEESMSSETLAMLKRLNISSLGHTFTNFRATTSELQKAVKALQDLSQGKLAKQFVMLYGTTGCGKTHLIEALVIEWVNKGLPTRYHTFSDIARRLKAGLRKPQEYEDYFKAYCEQARLVIDDIGMGTTESRFEMSDLEDIIDQRYRRRYYPDNELVTVISTNKDPRELPERIISRFRDFEFGLVLNMGNQDYRRRKV